MALLYLGLLSAAPLKLSLPILRDYPSLLYMKSTGLKYCSLLLSANLVLAAQLVRQIIPMEVLVSAVNHTSDAMTEKELESMAPFLEYRWTALGTEEEETCSTSSNCTGLHPDFNNI